MSSNRIGTCSQLIHYTLLEIQSLISDDRFRMSKIDTQQIAKCVKSMNAANSLFVYVIYCSTR